MPRDHAYCTVFDRNYAARGLALYRSLERHADEFRLFAVCMDAEAKTLLDRLDAPQLVAIGVDELEEWDPQLAEVRPSRTAVEYAWTAVPAVCRFLLEREALVTYLDADLFFFDSPEPLFEELGDDSILVVPHRMDPRDEAAQGKFNVGWVTVRRDADGMAALDWWRERCLEWCHARVERGRFGDQKYLDEWPRRFDGVRVSANVGAGLGPWNQTRHRLDAGADASLTADGEPVVFFHYSGLTLHPAGDKLSALALQSGVYRLADPLLWTIRARHRGRMLDVVWAPYVERCAAAHAELVGAGAPPHLGLAPLTRRALAAAVARERAPGWARDAHLAVRRRVMARRAARPPRSDTACPW
jgi:hypothetical protein